MLPVIFIVGPTCVGKTEVSLRLARFWRGEIVSADSMLVYREPQIITAKPLKEVRLEIPHHLIDIISVEKEYNVFEYYKDATSIIKRLVANKIPTIVCGGSGLYVKSILDGIFEGGVRDDRLRNNLRELADNYGTLYLHRELRKVDTEAAKRISPNDLKRIIRALEEYYLTGIPISKKQTYAYGLYGALSVRIIGLIMKRDILYRKIENRVDEMLERGAVDEVKFLKSLNLSMTAQKIIGIEELGNFLDGKITLERASYLMKLHSRHLAKKQITWFKKDKRIEWVDIDNLSYDDIVKIICTKIGGK